MKRFILPFLSFIALTIVASTVHAGVEPSPFRLNSQRLDVISTNVNGVITMVDAVMGIDPEPWCTAPDSVKAE